MKVRFIKRTDVPRWQSFLAPFISILLGLGAGALLIMVTGNDPVLVYRTILGGAFSSKYGISETIVKAIPLMIVGLAVSVAFRMRLWNIGAEGQIYAGALAASWLALFHPDLPKHIMLPGMLLLGFVGGGLWALPAAMLRAYWQINEVIITLMMNYVAILGTGYLVYGPWKDPMGFNFPLSARFVLAAHLPTLGDTRIHLGLGIAILVAGLLSFILWRTKWGYEIRVIGISVSAARYAGMKVIRNIILGMVVSGGLAGIAGMTEVSGVIHRMQPQISPGYGYSAIIIACLARLNPWGILIVSYLFGALLVGGYAVQSIGMSSSVAGMLQGSILFFVLASETFLNYRVLLIRRRQVLAEKGEKSQR